MILPIVNTTYNPNLLYMIKEFNYQHYHTFICNTNNLKEIIEISNTQSIVQGSEKTNFWKDLYKEKIKEILEKTNDKLFISGVRNLKTNQLIAYMITSIPYDQSCFMFFKFGEIRKSNDLFSLDAGGYGVWKLGLANGEEKGSYDAFFAIRANAYRPIMRVVKKYSFLDEGVVRYNWQLNNIVMPNQSPKNPIEKALILDNEYTLKRIHPIAIGHASLKPEERVKHFSNFFEDKSSIVKKESVQR